MEVNYSKETHHLYKTAAYRLFYLKYDVVAPRRALMTKFELEVLGFPITGDPEIDANPDGGLDKARLSVMEMAQIYNRGISFGIVDQEEVLLIYNDIQQHLSDWQHALDRFDCRNRCPIVSLELFEQLAADLHHYAAAHLDGRSAEINALSAIMMVGRNRTTHKHHDFLVEPYVSTVDQIKRRMAAEQFGLYDPANEE